MRRGVAALGACCLVSACGAHGSTRVTSPDASTSMAPSSPRAVTLRAVDDLLRSVLTPPGSRVATPREAAGLTPLSTTVSSSFIDHHTAYVVPLSVDDTIAWYQANPPAGTIASGSGSSSSSGTLTSSGLSFDGHRTADYETPEVQVNVSPSGADRSMVRIDAQAIWVPRRGPSDQIPLSETSVDVALYGRTGSPVKGTVTGSAVGDLARLVNRLHAVTEGGYNCPNDTGEHDVLVFRGRGPDRTVNAGVLGCGFVVIGVNGHHSKPGLWGGALVDRAVRRALGVSPHH
jgi:hypothetical protein